MGSRKKKSPREEFYNPFGEWGTLGAIPLFPQAGNEVKMGEMLYIFVFSPLVPRAGTCAHPLLEEQSSTTPC